MKGHKPLIKAYTGQVVCDVVFLNSIYNAKYWFTKMNKGSEDIILLPQQVLILIIIMMNIDKDNKLPKMCNEKVE